MLISVAGMAQSTLPLRADTVTIEKIGGNATLKIKNQTRDSMGGVLYNIGGGVTGFKKSRKITDTSFTVGGDTLAGIGRNMANASLRANFNYEHNWAANKFWVDSISTLYMASKGFSFSTLRNGLTYIYADAANSSPGTFSTKIYKIDGASDSLNYSFRFTETAAIVESENVALNKRSSLVSTPGILTLSATDSIRIQAIPSASTDSVFAPGPYNPVTRTRTVYAVPSSAIGGNNNLQQTMDIGNTTNRRYRYDSAATATDGSAKGGYIAEILPLDRTGNPPSLLFSLGATKFTGVNRRDNVFHFGWNINAGGGAQVAGESGIGESWEHTYIPAVGDTIDAEKHDFYITRSGQQKRLASYTIRDNVMNYDFYHTISRFYIKLPTTDRVYFNTEPTTTGASSTWLLSETKKFSLAYDSTQGVVAALGGFTSPTAPTFTFQGFDRVITPTLDITNIITASTGVSIQPATDNTNELGIDSKRWKNIWGRRSTTDTAVVTAIGLGTSTPLSTIHIQGSNSDFKALRLQNSNAAGPNPYGLIWQAGSTGDGVTGFQSALVAEAIADGGMAISSYAQDIRFFTNVRTLQATLKASGNLLLGTATDNGAKFQVNGNSTYAGTATYNTTLPFVNFQRSSVSYGLFGLSNGANVLVQGSVANDFCIRSNSAMLFSTDAGVTTHAYLSTGGNLLLNSSTDDTNNRLQVNGTVKAASYVTTQTTMPTSTADGVGQTGEIRADANYIYFKTSGGWKRAALSTF